MMSEEADVTGPRPPTGPPPKIPPPPRDEDNPAIHLARRVYLYTLILAALFIGAVVIFIL